MGRTDKERRDAAADAFKLAKTRDPEAEPMPIEPSMLALKMQSLFIEQAEKLNTIHEFVATTKQAMETMRGELARSTSTIQKLRDEVATHRQVIEEVKTLVRDGLTLERQRLAKERDIDHQTKLGRIAETPRGTHDNITEINEILNRLDKIDAGMKERGELIDPPTPRPAMESAAQALREKAASEKAD